MNKLNEGLKSLTTVVDSHLDTHYRIGMRVVKTAAAVMICLLIALLSGGLDYMSIAAVSAIVTIRPTHGETLSTGIFRIIGTFFGGAIGILTVIIGLFMPYYSEGVFVIILPVMLLLNLYLCNVLQMQDSCTISCVVTIIVAAHINLDSTVGGALIFTLHRLRDTLIGVVVATILNIVPYHIAALLKKNKEPDKAPDEDNDKASESTPVEEPK